MVITKKRFDALYVQAFGMKFYTEAYFEKEKAEYEFSSTYPGPIVTTKSSEENKQIQKKYQNIIKCC